MPSIAPRSEITHPLAAPPHDEPVPILDGLFWLRTRLPFALDHINIWLADDGDAWTVIDTGVGDGATAALWDRLLDGFLAGKPVARVLVTHFHPDHIGQAGHLCARTAAPLWMSQTEWLTAKALSLDTTEDHLDEGQRFDRLAGLEPELIQLRRERGNLYRKGAGRVPASFRRIEAGETVRMAGGDWQVIVGQGHAPEQVTLWSAERRMLIAADQILPRITPVIGVWSACPDADPLHEFAQSLALYDGLDADAFVLPSHGLPFTGLPARLAQLRRHHDERLGRAAELAAEPATAAAIMRRLFTRELSINDIGFALAETVAHLNALVNEGRLEREPHPDGAWRYRRTG